MARITVEDCLDKVGNRFSLVMLVSKRTKQLMRGSKPMVSSKDNKAIVTSLRVKLRPAKSGMILMNLKGLHKIRLKKI